MNQQEIFDTVVEKLAMQGGPARQFAGCAYETQDGKHCAVGALLTKDEIAKIMNNGANGRGVNTLYHSNLLPTRYKEHVPFLCALQTAHDCADYVREDGGNMKWKKGEDSIYNALTRVAMNYNLNVEKLKLFKEYA